ncbi:hypothetical protein TWF694_005940 [Orbilia ellipsospora]|uniref:Uncharacterized protein n=1 Tax=Orbilia ellipsospora TaxID=2528407 RepID=A0AAV9WTF1_9PEZI
MINTTQEDEGMDAPAIGSSNPKSGLIEDAESADLGRAWGVSLCQPKVTLASFEFFETIRGNAMV